MNDDLAVFLTILILLIFSAWVLPADAQLDRLRNPRKDGSLLPKEKV